MSSVPEPPRLNEADEQLITIYRELSKLIGGYCQGSRGIGGRLGAGLEEDAKYILLRGNFIGQLRDDPRVSKQDIRAIEQALPLALSSIHDPYREWLYGRLRHTVLSVQGTLLAAILNGPTDVCEKSEKRLEPKSEQPEGPGAGKTIQTLYLNTSPLHFEQWLQYETRSAPSEVFESKAGNRYSLQKARRTSSTTGELRLALEGFVVKPDASDDSETAWPLSAAIEFSVVSLAADRVKVVVTCRQPFAFRYFERLVQALWEAWPESRPQRRLPLANGLSLDLDRLTDQSVGSGDAWNAAVLMSVLGRRDGTPAIAATPEPRSKARKRPARGNAHFQDANAYKEAVVETLVRLLESGEKLTQERLSEAFIKTRGLPAVSADGRDIRRWNREFGLEWAALKSEARSRLISGKTGKTG